MFGFLSTMFLLYTIENEKTIYIVHLESTKYKSEGEWSQYE